MASSLKSRLSRLRSLGLVRGAELPSPEDTQGKTDPGPRGGSSIPRPSRLARARAVGERPHSLSPASGLPTAHGRPSFLAEWEEVAPLVYRREIPYADPLPSVVDPRPFLGSDARPRVIDSAENSGPLPAESFRFFDLETTGLSGGAGTIAFLAAVGRVEGGEFSVSQFFLADYPGEPAFIAVLLEALGRTPALVSYNGRCFDLPLLKARCVMCGLHPVTPNLHLDVLYAFRRLWRRIYGGASLGLLEDRVLGIERAMDVPGSEVPRVYFDYLATGEQELMPAVFAHNAEDVLSLATLLARVDRIFAKPRERAAREQVDLGGLARLLFRLGRVEEGEDILEAAAGEGDGKAALHLARLRRRAGKLSGALVALDLAPPCYEAAIERSRLAERLAHDLEMALAAAEEARALATSGDEAAAAARRLHRLQRRLRRRLGRRLETRNGPSKPPSKFS